MCRRWACPWRTHNLDPRVIMGTNRGHSNKTLTPVLGKSRALNSLLWPDVGNPFNRKVKHGTETSCGLISDLSFASKHRCVAVAPFSEPLGILSDLGLERLSRLPEPSPGFPVGGWVAQLQLGLGMIRHCRLTSLLADASLDFAWHGGPKLCNPCF